MFHLIHCMNMFAKDYSERPPFIRMFLHYVIYFERLLGIPGAQHFLCFIGPNEYSSDHISFSYYTKLKYTYKYNECPNY